MGNYISCTLSGPGGNKQSRGVKVIFPSGEISHFYQPIKAAELMLETPNFFLVNTRSLHIGRRFSALNADEDLEMGNVYVMFPMKRLNSLVSAGDMGALLLTANSVSKRVSIASFRILPECAESSAVEIEQIHGDYHEKTALPKLNLDDIEEFSTEEFKQRLSMCRSKKPLLETIAEEPGFSSRFITHGRNGGEAVAGGLRRRAGPTITATGLISDDDRSVAADLWS
ncbi:hypothetical protein HAX54_031637 [Datura stramonium]|uniref:DUF4228 domain protein n=1 Tax=Datura stramonium TaxID=4076 RepID=A0ABS8SC63_DATST|nr:hypothetical protein [Datura stramonium]